MRLGTCESCGEGTRRQLCPDGYCRSCHVSLLFEDCCDGTWAAAVSLQIRPASEVRKMYPNANMGRARSMKP